MTEKTQEEIAKTNATNTLRSRIRNLNKKPAVVKLSKADAYGNQVAMTTSGGADPDEFELLYGHGTAIKPPYDFGWLATLYEESDVLLENVAARVHNTVGLGYEFSYIGPDFEKDSPQAVDERQLLENFFDAPNERESWYALSNLVAREECYLGNGAIEFIRNNLGEIILAYHISFKDLRLVPYSSVDAVVEEVPLLRKGRLEKISMSVQYRRFMLKRPNGKVRYFKSIGDSRPMTQAGEFGTSDKSGPASEILWFPGLTTPLSPYGLPEHVGSVFDVMGRRYAQVMNWSTLKRQGIPRLLILIDGVMSDQSWEDLYELMDTTQKGQEPNSLWVLELSGRMQDIKSRTAPTIKIHDLSNAQLKDQLHSAYLDATGERIRQAYRHTPALVGSTGSYSYTALNASKSIGEEQVFRPAKIRWDDKINRYLVNNAKGFNCAYWKYKTKGAEIVGTEELLQAVSTVRCLSIDQILEVLGSALGRKFTPYGKAWSAYPFEMVLSALNRTGVKGAEDLSVDPATPADTNESAVKEPAPSNELNMTETDKEDFKEAVGLVSKELKKLRESEKQT